MNTQASISFRRVGFLVFAAGLVLAALLHTGLVSGATGQALREERGRLAATPDPRPQVQIEDHSSAIMQANESNTLRLEIAENGTKFTPDETPVFDDGLPAFGNEFITEGYIYPQGTLNGPNGVNPDGTPQFPNRVIGRWVCRGWHVGDGAHTVTGPWVITHQIFDLARTPGRMTIATDGFESPEVGLPIKRAITGGTGEFSEVRGESTQVFLGFNRSNGVSLLVEIRPAKK
jgi:hypothetical protein